MKTALAALRFGEVFEGSSKPSKRPAAVDVMKVVVFFVSIAIISVCLFVFVESYPRQKPSAEYEKAAAEMRESLYNAAARIGQTARPHELKLAVINGEYRVVKR
ncbi:MAG: hypothetical protein OEV28_06150 [Nitrospirota bacterium]|nr:hypothetical protein [Nitrospirota bacterium]